MKQLSGESFSKAREFVKAQARELDQRLFEYCFEGGDRQAVLQALQKYQNEDGGFGHAIEPDFRLPPSSPMATSMGLNLLRELEAPAGHPMVQKAIGYLLAAFDPQKGYWISVPAKVNDYPHAPWWHNDENSKKGSVETPANPSAELVGYLHTWPDLVPADFLQRVTASSLASLNKQPDAMDMHDLICLVSMASALPERLRQSVQGKLGRSLQAVVATDPQAWASYRPQPLMYVQSPASAFAGFLQEALEKNLDYLIETQGADGSWAPNWSWGGNYPEAWEQARRDWQGKMTGENLRILKAFGRLSS
jgi:hypothetical protein